MRLLCSRSSGVPLELGPFYQYSWAANLSFAIFSGSLSARIFLSYATPHSTSLGWPTLHDLFLFPSTHLYDVTVDDKLERWMSIVLVVVVVKLTGPP